ncbi:hypothetical protein [Gordonia rhizosphera]|uniref:Uncharacterized protein n=1 Tax=Gordonia rhizosphera NBRC 16068 TaxID=1108045 RepID=K6W8X2_9ACTN|nr:hypothetical protein [Gordonia rhizosphera]GAB88662.1 hypothetical protein GORHZ_035_00020 [Gordonia rhizosphera NBRC 16068]
MTISTLTSAPPSGRRRPVIIDDTDYSTAVIRQGSQIPWTDLGALAGHYGQVQSLLGPDAAWVDVQRWQQAQLAAAPRIVDDMGARARIGYPLRTLLGDEGLLEEFTKTVITISDATRRRIVLGLPSPGTWLGWAHAVAGNPLDEIDFDSADSASMYVAEWLGQLGSLPVDLILLDASTPLDGLDESLRDYTAITNVIGHLGWSAAMRHPDRVETTGEIVIADLPPGYWNGGAPIPDGDLILAAIPPTSSPEEVLDKLGQLN